MNTTPLSDMEIEETAEVLGQLHDLTERMAHNLRTCVDAGDAMSMAEHFITPTSLLRIDSLRFERGRQVNDCDDPGWQALGMLTMLNALVDEPDVLQAVARKCRDDLREALLR